MNELTVLQRANSFRLADDARVVSRKDKGGIEIVSHFFHQPDDCVSRRVVKIGGRLIGQNQLGLSD